ncbi:hypothetical protein DL95DRAFT_399437 [Leptodontidium sp. 2 PMI_412]|nr:hypothetical protein DL95DRAFT_399437 [Leptodontidium sp. 2 PMI_412]
MVILENALMPNDEWHPSLERERNLYVNAWKCCPPAKKRSIYVWLCCECAQSGINIQTADCPGCQAPRCAYCPTTKVRVQVR